MNYFEAQSLLKGAGFLHFRTLTSKAAMVILLGVNNSTWGVESLHKITGFKKTDIRRILGNLRENKILVGRTFDWEISRDIEFNWMVLFTVAKLGAGRISNEDTYEDVLAVNRPEGPGTLSIPHLCLN